MNGTGRDGQETGLTERLEDNIAIFNRLFSDDDLMGRRQVRNGHLKVRFCIFYAQGLADGAMINSHLLRPLMEMSEGPKKGADFLDYLSESVIQITGIKRCENVDEIARGLAYGRVLLLVEHQSAGLLMDARMSLGRSITEPDGEKTLSGPREGFTESLQQNLSMLRRILCTGSLKIKTETVGRYSNSQAAVVFLDGIAEEALARTVQARLREIDIDGALDTNYLSELICRERRTTFCTIGTTERPDVVAGKLLEGRVAVLLDGSPMVLTLPYLFVENFQSSEDYYVNFYYGSFSRVLRIIGFFLAIIVPALYVAVVAFHQEMLPMPLMINIAVDSDRVPLPAALEAVLLLIMFDIIRETGMRMPLGIGQSLSIVGALVVGSAAVEADLISAPMIIITAISGITSLLIPKMSASILYIRLGLLLAAAMFGFFGLALGLSVVFIHILKLESFGVSQLTRDSELSYQRLKDSCIRVPWWQMLTRPQTLTRNTRRQKGGREAR